MTFVYNFYLFYLFKIVCLNIFLEFLSFIHMISKLSILFNHTKYFKRLALCYILFPFIILKSPHLMGQLAYLEKMTLIQGKNCPVHKD